MNIIQTPLQGCVVIEPSIFKDPRGYFFESFNEKKFYELTGSETRFVQDNQSFSSYGVLRGLHFQKGEHAQAKLVRVLQGEVLDVAVDLRWDSATFGKHFSILLSAENKRQLFIPRGFAHGFVVLSPRQSPSLCLLLRSREAIIRLIQLRIAPSLLIDFA